jgi:hypothetical protein
MSEETMLDLQKKSEPKKVMATVAEADKANGNGPKPARPKRKVKAKAKKSARVAKKSAKKKSASRASSRLGSGRKSKAGKVPGHWSKTHAQLVLHATPQLVAKLDRKLATLGKRFKLERPTRGSVVRALVEAAVK